MVFIRALFLSYFTLYYRYMSDGSSLVSKLKFPLLLLGDVFFYYAALLATVFLRYGTFDIRSEIFQVHNEPFSIALLFWILAFYSGGLYENIALKNRRVLVRRFISLTLIGAGFLILLLYFVPVFGVTPKINLLLFTIVFLAFGLSWHIAFAQLLRLRAGINKKRILLVGDGEALTEITEYLTEDQHLGYEIVEQISLKKSGQENALGIIQGGTILQTIVVPYEFYKSPEAVTALYKRLITGTEVVTIPDFYERLFGRVSISEIDQTWLLQNMPQIDSAYVSLKHILGVILGLVAFLILLPVTILIALLVGLTSRGPIFYVQERTGFKGKRFKLYKFRSMYNTPDKNPDARADKAIWTTKKDPRVTPVGRVLRWSHLDELPQLINVLRGEMSFVGPRPERPIFIQDLERQIPYYNLRDLAKPGITGWAQIRYPYGASVEDAYKKLQYDLYYLKHRSFFLDTSIVLKTLKKFFI